MVRKINTVGIDKQEKRRDNPSNFPGKGIIDKARKWVPFVVESGA